jgi:Flp pilus assembly protein TadD
MLLGLTSTPVIAATSPPSVREYDAPCAKCHRNIYNSYLATPMANASGLATDRLIPVKFLHAKSNIEYQVSKENDTAWLTYRNAADPSTLSGREKLDYFLGSGHLGLTYLYSKNGYLLESPVAWYANLKAYDMKPGLGNIEHLPGALTVDTTCLRCHMSAVQHPDPGTENHYRGLPFLQVGITCESCHGDASQHVASKGIAAIVDPIKLDPAKRDSTCILCHLEGNTSVEHRDRSVLNFQPGQNISDYISYFVYARENTTRRGVSEIEQFSSSKCKQASGAAMSCMNCHDPHRSPTPEERVAFYRGKCLACHSQAKFSTAHYPANPDCASCHMPKTGAQNIPHVAWTDHRIRQHPEREESANADPLNHEMELTPILPGSTSPRDLALAYYNLAVNGNTAERPRATALLNAAAMSSPDDEAVLRALGVLSEWNGDSARAEQLYRTLLAKDPDSLTATTNLGTLLAKSGNLQAAAALWQPAFARNEDLVGLGQNLATLECMLGEKDKSIEVLKRALIYSPDIPELQNKLSQIESQGCPTKIHPPLTLSNP